MKVYIAEMLIIPGEKYTKEQVKDELGIALYDTGFAYTNVQLKEAEVVLCEDG